MSERREGWYWVKYAKGDEWQCAYYDPWSDAFLFAEWGAISSHSVKQVGPRIPSPDETFAVVPVEPTQEMIEEGAKAIVSWDEGCEWPKSWGADADRHRKDCRKSYHAMLSASPNP